MGAYDNPQRVVNNSFNALIQSGKQLTNNIATTAQQIAANVKAQKKQLQEKQDALDIEQQSMFSKVNELPSTSSEKLDNNIHSFWDEQVDRYFQIKNEMDAGTYEGGRAAGNKELARINALVPQFQAQAKYLGEQCAGYNKALKEDQLSSTGSMINKNFLQSLCDGGDVKTVIKDGQLAYQLGEDDEAEFLNGTALMSNAAGEENLFNTKADYTKPLENLFNKTAQTDSPDSDTYETIQVKKGDPIPGQPGKTFQNLTPGFMYTMQYVTPEKKELYLKNAYNSPMMNTIISDEKGMLSQWQDNIPDEGENSITEISAEIGIDDNALAELNMTMDDLVNSSWHEYPTNFTDDQKQKLDDIQNKIAKTYLARKSFANNGLQLGSIKTKDRVKIEPPMPKKGSGSGNDEIRFTSEGGANYTANMEEDIKAKITDESSINERFPAGSNEFNNVSDVKKFRKNLSVDYPGIDEVKFDIFFNPPSQEKLRKALYEIKGLDSKYQIGKKDYQNFQNKSNTNKSKAY